MNYPNQYPQQPPTYPMSPQPFQSYPPPPRHRNRGLIVVAAIGAGFAAMIALIVLIGAAVTSSDKAAVHKSAPAVLPATSAPATGAPAAPRYTASQQSAIQDARSYLQTEPGFSRRGLIGQLRFDKFSRADARFAVKHLHVNWNQQAAADARSYMKSEGGFSYGSMVQQLEFDKFTPKQAAYGAKAVGL
jgi:hypothetical protein